MTGPWMIFFMNGVHLIKIFAFRAAMLSTMALN
jgi:hypothetical protein